MNSNTKYSAPFLCAVRDEKAISFTHKGLTAWGAGTLQVKTDKLVWSSDGILKWMKGNKNLNYSCSSEYILDYSLSGLNRIYENSHLHFSKHCIWL